MTGFKTFLNEHNEGLLSHSNIDQMILQLYTTGSKIKQIEERTGKWRNYIYGVLQREGIRANRLNQTRELTIQLHGSGVSAQKIAELTSQSERNVREIISKYRKGMLLHDA